MANLAGLFLLAIMCFEAFFRSGLGQYDRTFDYFRLALEWAPGVCSERPRRCLMNPLPRNFTIHGFYPMENEGPLIHDCYYVEYTPIEWQDLVDRLNRNWPSIVNGADRNAYHWSKQWIKHGTCSLIFYYQLMYFDLASDLKDDYDLLSALRDRGIAPTNLFVYSIQEIKEAVEDYTTKICDINCIVSYTGYLLISEIRLCFSPGGEIIDCYPNWLGQGCIRPYAYFAETIM